MSLEEEIAQIVTNAVEEILRLVGRDDVAVPAPEDITVDVPATPRPQPRPAPRQPTTTDPILAGFLGLDR